MSHFSSDDSSQTMY